MTLEELDAEFVAAGMPALAEYLRGRHATVTPDRTGLLVEVMREDRTVEETFADEDALCRSMRLDALVRTPPTRFPIAPRTVPPVLPTPGASAPYGNGPRVRWRRPISPQSYVVARADGAVVLTDTRALVAHGSDGALLLSAIDVASGRERWSVPVWPPARTPVVGAAGDVLLTCTHGELAALALADGVERWRVPWTESPVLLFSGAGHAVVTGPRLGHRAETPATGISLSTGAETWRGTIANPRGALPPRRILRVEASEAHLRVLEVDPADGSGRLLHDVPRPPGYAAATGWFPRGDRDGLLLLRASDGYGQAGDVVLLPGEPEALPIHPGLVQRPRHSAEPYDHEHVILSPAEPWRDDSTLLHVTHGECWSREALLLIGARGPGRTVLNQLARGRGSTRAPRPGPTVEAVAPDGTTAWARPGSAVLDVDDEVWVLDEGVLTGVAVADGAERWSVPWELPPPSRARNGGPSGYHDADRHGVRGHDGELYGYG